jgi:hypothetical protein
MNDNSTQKYTLIALIISILLHLIFIFTFKKFSRDDFLVLIPKKQLAKEVNRIENRPNFTVFELIDVPEFAKTEAPPKDPTNLVSDKNAIARDNYKPKDKPIGDPYSKGDVPIKGLSNHSQNPSAQGGSGGIQQAENVAADQKKVSPFPNEPSYLGNIQYHEKFSRQALLGRNGIGSPVSNKPSYKNEDFNARGLGGFSFNTYEWDFAPYMLDMKRKVEKNIFPPPAFTLMGIMEGETMLRFKVMPSGEVRDIEVLNYIGHKALMETSINAIKSSKPFKPLPSDFPENFLEVTAIFTYYVQRER